MSSFSGVGHNRYSTFNVEKDWGSVAGFNDPRGDIKVNYEEIEAQAKKTYDSVVNTLNSFFAKLSNPTPSQILAKQQADIGLAEINKAFSGSVADFTAQQAHTGTPTNTPRPGQ